MIYVLKNLIENVIMMTILTKTPPHHSHNIIDTNINNIVKVKIINDDNKYKCIYCNLVCSRSDSLNRHTNIVKIKITLIK